MPATAHATLTNRPLIDTGYRHSDAHKKIRRTPKIIPVPRDTHAIRQLAVLHQTRNDGIITPDLRDAFLKVWRTTRAAAFVSTVPIERDHASDIVIGGKKTTPQALADWCNNLADRLGINRINPKGPYYVPPALPSHFGA